MPNRLMDMRILFAVLIAALASAGALAQNAQRGAQRGQAATAARTFNPRDLSGFWDITNTGLPAGALNATSNNRPPMTPWALEKFRKTKTGVANALSNGRTANENDWNDPIRWCDPTGFPRIIWSPRPAGMRFAQTKEEVIQFFETERAWRDIWTDGRKLPGPDADSNWYGYAVGRWEGDTFVVNSNGFNEATWLDQYGSPHSDQMTVEERYRRVDREHLEMTLSITDPKAYVGTWKGDKKIFQLVEKPTRSPYNDFNENICVWSETKREIKQ